MQDVIGRLARERTLRQDRLATAFVLGGIAVLAAVVAIGAYLGLQAGLFYSGAGGSGPARAWQVLETTGTWLLPLGLTALSGFMVAVVVTLRRIIRTITLRRDAFVAIGARSAR